MEKLAAMLGGYVYKHIPQATFSYEIYKYSFEVLLESAAGIIASICIAVFLDMKFEGVVFFIEFFLLRSFAGGLHFKKFLYCFIGSALVMYGTLLAVKYLPVSLTVSFCLMIFSIAAFLLTDQVNDKNREVSADETIHFKKKLFQVLVTIFCAYILFAGIGWTKYAFLVSLTLAVVYIIMLAGKWKNSIQKA